MSDIVAHRGRCGMEKLKMVMCAEVNEGLGLVNVVGTGPCSKGMAGQRCYGSFELKQNHEVSWNEKHYRESNRHNASVVLHQLF